MFVCLSHFLLSPSLWPSFSRSIFFSVVAISFSSIHSLYLSLYPTFNLCVSSPFNNTVLCFLFLCLFAISHPLNFPLLMLFYLLSLYLFSILVSLHLTLLSFFFLSSNKSILNIFFYPRSLVHGNNYILLSRRQQKCGYMIFFEVFPFKTNNHKNIEGRKLCSRSQVHNGPYWLIMHFHLWSFSLDALGSCKNLNKSTC